MIDADRFMGARRARGPSSWPARRPWLIAGLASIVALIGAAALFVWVTQGGNIAFDLAAIFCA